mmetsp:Transcript_2786/g.4171  ORF Transcript_2786/g.4171 Transcript_2786/m.4171 type:complete len:102 (+) Transcript_2786:643-948(+)
MSRATTKSLQQRLMLSDSAGSGSWVDLEDHVDGGVIDHTQWYNVSIPMADLVSDDFELQSVFLINFTRMMGNVCCNLTGVIDNPTAIPAFVTHPKIFTSTK